jgi:hypothetical protein
MHGSTARADKRHDTADDGEAGSRCMRVCGRCTMRERRRAGADGATAVKAEHGIWGEGDAGGFFPMGKMRRPRASFLAWMGFLPVKSFLRFFFSPLF